MIINKYYYLFRNESSKIPISCNNLYVSPLLTHCTSLILFILTERPSLFMFLVPGSLERLCFFISVKNGEDDSCGGLRGGSGRWVGGSSGGAAEDEEGW